MNQRTPTRSIAVGFGLALTTLVLPACGGAVASGAATAKVGRDLGAHAVVVPAGAEVCALKDALAAPGGPDKPTSEVCAKQIKSDQLWRRSLVVLGAYSDTLGSLAAGADAESVGPLEAAQTGIEKADWIDVEDGPEKAARQAAYQLVDQMRTSKGDLGERIKGAGPQVKELCDGLKPYLEAQVKGLGEARKEIEKKRAQKLDRRCGTLDTKSICVSESATDKIVAEDTLADLAIKESRHVDAHQALTAFCAAHVKLEEAAKSGDLKDNKTYLAVVDAVKAAHQAKAPEADATQAPKK